MAAAAGARAAMLALLLALLAAHGARGAGAVVKGALLFSAVCGCRAAIRVSTRTAGTSAM